MDTLIYEDETNIIHLNKKQQFQYITFKNITT